MSDVQQSDVCLNCNKTLTLATVRLVEFNDHTLHCETRAKTGQQRHTIRGLSIKFPNFVNYATDSATNGMCNMLRSDGNIG